MATSKPRSSAGTVYRLRDPNTGKVRPIWWLNYVAPGGRRVRESAGTTVKAEAVAKLRARMGEVSSGRFVGPEAERVTFEDLMAGLERSYQLAGRRSTRRVQTAKEHLSRAFARGAGPSRSPPLGLKPTPWPGPWTTRLPQQA